MLLKILDVLIEVLQESKDSDVQLFFMGIVVLVVASCALLGGV